MQKLIQWYHRERPVLIGALVAIVNAVQVAAIPLPTWAHTLIVVASVLLGAGNVRQGVTPALGASGIPGPASDDLLPPDVVKRLGT